MVTPRVGEVWVYTAVGIESGPPVINKNRKEVIPVINITLTVNTNKELTAMLDTLKKEGLINKLSIIEPEEINTPAKQPVQMQPVQPVQLQPAQPVQPVQTQPVQPVQMQPQSAQPVQPQLTQPQLTQPQTAQPQTTQIINPVQPLPTTAPSYTLEQLSLAAARGLMDTGRQPELIQLLAKYGIQALTQLPKEQYGAFATDLRAMGCKI